MEITHASMTKTTNRQDQAHILQHWVPLNLVNEVETNRVLGFFFSISFSNHFGLHTVSLTANVLLH